MGHVTPSGGKQDRRAMEQRWHPDVLYVYLSMMSIAIYSSIVKHMHAYDMRMWSKISLMIALGGNYFTLSFKIQDLRCSKKMLYTVYNTERESAIICNLES